MKLSKIAALFMVPVLALCLVACSAPGGNASESASSDPKIAELTAQKPANADEAAELYAKLMQKENEIFSSDNALWEKVFNAANKDSAMIEDGSNYGDFCSRPSTVPRMSSRRMSLRRSRPVHSRSRRSRTSSRAWRRSSPAVEARRAQARASTLRPLA